MTQQEINLDELEAFFASVPLPKDIQFDSGTTIHDLPSFLQNYFRTLRSNISPAVAEPRIYRLMKLKELLLKQQES